MTTVIKDKDGNVINIGPWEYNLVGVANPDADNLLWSVVKDMLNNNKDPSMLYDDNGDMIMEALNPLPEESYPEESEVSDTKEGRIAVDDYRTHRRVAYPSLPDQQDMQFHDLNNGTTIWLETIQAVKVKYPKKVS